MTPLNPKTLRIGSLIASITLLTSLLSAGNVVFSEDFTEPTVRTDFPYVGGTGPSAYKIGEWVAFHKDDYGSVFEDGVAKVNANQYGQWGIAIVLDLSEHGPGSYTVSFDLKDSPAGVFSIAEIENLGSVRILTNKVASETFAVGESKARVSNLLNRSGKGWKSVYDAANRKQARFKFKYDGTGLIGFALSAFNQKVTIDNFTVTAN
jgi:hypothetical protein